MTTTMMMTSLVYTLNTSLPVAFFGFFLAADGDGEGVLLLLTAFTGLGWICGE
jgi:hypothetical protein